MAPRISASRAASDATSEPTWSPESESCPLTGRARPEGFGDLRPPAQAQKAVGTPGSAGEHARVSTPPRGGTARHTQEGVHESHAVARSKCRRAVPGIDLHAHETDRPNASRGVRGGRG
eukprot:1900374-Rhodomonas_salina.1